MITIRSNDDSLTQWIGVALLFLWIGVLVFHLNDKEIELAEKICWTLVLILLPPLGLFLYPFFGPRGFLISRRTSPNHDEAPSEATIADTPRDEWWKKYY